MVNDHIPILPKSIWGLKIAQLVLSVIVLALSAFQVYCVALSGHAFAVFAAIFSTIVLVYYFIALHGAPKGYNWIAVLVLECLNLIFWLCTFAVLAAIYSAWGTVSYSSYYVYYTKRSLHERDIYYEDLATAYAATLIATIAFATLNFILFCITLAFMSLSVHQHRKDNKPLRHDEDGGTSWKHSKGKAEVSPTIPTYPAFIPPSRHEEHHQMHAPSHGLGHFGPLPDAPQTQPPYAPSASPPDDVGGALRGSERH